MIKWVWQRVWSLRRDPGETGRRGQMGRMMQTPRGMTRWTVAHWIIFQVHSTWNSTSLQNIVKRTVRLFFINHLGYPSNYASFLSSIGYVQFAKLCLCLGLNFSSLTFSDFSPFFSCPTFPIRDLKINEDNFLLFKTTYSQAGDRTQSALPFVYRSEKVQNGRISTHSG